MIDIDVVLHDWDIWKEWISTEGFNFDELPWLPFDQLSHFPKTSGIYIVKKFCSVYDFDEVLYVGQTTNFHRRFLQHRSSTFSHIKESAYFLLHVHFLFGWSSRKNEIDLLEKTIIRKYNPPFNKNHTFV